jgi:uncharacterized membrane protein HdeD (DUF308 family)
VRSIAGVLVRTPRNAAPERQEIIVADPIQSTYGRIWWSLVLRGLFAIAIGVLIIMKPLDSIAAFALVIAIWALFTGIIQIVHAFDLRSVINHWWVMLLSGIIGVGFGIAALYYYPALSLTFAVVWVAWWLLLTGALAIYLAIQERQMQLEWGWTLAFGILSVVVAVLAFMNPPSTVVAIMGLIAGFAIVAGVLLLIGAFRLSSVKSDVLSRVRAAATS